MRNKLIRQAYLSGKFKAILPAFYYLFTCTSAIFLVTSILPSRLCAQEPEFRLSHLFSPEACIADLNFYKSKLEQTHPNLYLYTPPAEFNRYYDSLVAQIVHPLNSINFYNTITSLLSIIKDGHTHIFPDPATTQHNDLHAPFFPFQIQWENKRMYVTRDFSSSNSIATGTEIQLINGLSASFLCDIMISRQIRDGENLTYPNWILERWFNTYYSYHMGNPTSYELVLRHPDGRIESLNIEGLTRDQISNYRQLRSSTSGESADQKGLTLSIDETRSTAILTIKDFHTTVLKKLYRQKFKKIIPGFFHQLQGQNIEHLILDLRDNQGGDIENGQILLAYLLEKPFQVVRGYAKVDPKTYADPLIRLQPAKGPGTSPYQPNAKRFHGKLYVLINGGTFSNSGIVCSVLRAHQRATFIGEETGGNPAMLSAGGKYILLPNTKTRVLIPTLQYDIQGRLANTGRGIMPDHEVKPTLSDIILDIDAELQFTLDLIQTSQIP